MLINLIAQTKEEKIKRMIDQLICPRCGRTMVVEYPFADPKLKSYHCGNCRIQGSVEEFYRYNI